MQRAAGAGSQRPSSPSTSHPGCPSARRVSTLLGLRPEPLRDPRFVLDVHLGRLAAYLRMLGFDALYRNHCADERLAEISLREHRILLTRDVGLLKRGSVTHGYYLRAAEPRQQLAEVVRRFDLGSMARPFSRCLRCNTPLTRASKEEVRHRLPAQVAALHDEFLRCADCGRAYWKGGHFRRMRNGSKPASRRRQRRVKPTPPANRQPRAQNLGTPSLSKYPRTRSNSSSTSAVPTERTI